MAFAIHGDRPQWMTIYEHLVGMTIGEIITDDKLQALLPEAPPTSVSGAFHRAVREMEVEHQRTFDRVRKVGYLMVESNQHERLARTQQTRAQRRLTAAHRKAHSADRARLTRLEIQRVDALELSIQIQREMLARQQHRLTVEVAERQSDTARMSDRMDRLEEALRRHGLINDPEPGD